MKIIIYLGAFFIFLILIFSSALFFVNVVDRDSWMNVTEDNNGLAISATLGFICFALSFLLIVFVSCI